MGARVPRGAEVSGVTHDSRAVEPGYAFVAVPGFKRDGARYAEDALHRGASLVVSEVEIPGVPTAIVTSARAALAKLACAVFGDPSSKMKVYGITGTNGKTTTSYVLHAMLAEAYGEEVCGLMTTAENISAGERRKAERTTPEASEVQRMLAGMLEKGVKKVVMEVSSHGIALDRVSGTQFAGALFTNLTRDHLDLHGTMEKYYAAKRELLRVSERPKLANADDSWGVRISQEIKGVETFGTTESALYRATNVESRRDGTDFTLKHPDGVLNLRTPLLGDYNVSNVSGAAALALAAGVETDAIERAARKMPQVPGRFERIAQSTGFEVIVDYAHTDVGLEASLKVARGVLDANGDSGRVICVFGAAGDRDGAKRPLMGEAASRLADFGIVTTDDAYSEDPAKIAREVVAGSDPSRTEVLLDRRAAIRRAIEKARRGDVVLVAGKGHEQVQHLPEGDVPFHDASVIREILAELEC